MQLTTTICDRCGADLTESAYKTLKYFLGRCADKTVHGYEIDWRVELCDACEKKFISILKSTFPFTIIKDR